MSVMSLIKKIFTLIIVLALLIGSVSISSLNASSVELNLYWYQISLPLGFMLLAFAALGMLFGMLLSWLFWTWPAKKRKTYWQREYFKLKRSEDERNAALHNPDNSDSLTTKNQVVKIP